MSRKRFRKLSQARKASPLTWLLLSFLFFYILLWFPSRKKSLQLPAPIRTKLIRTTSPLPISSPSSNGFNRTPTLLPPTTGLMPTLIFPLLLLSRMWDWSFLWVWLIRPFHKERRTLLLELIAISNQAWEKIGFCLVHSEFFLKQNIIPRTNLTHQDRRSNWIDS